MNLLARSVAPLALLLAISMAWIDLAPPASAQYFGRNKVQYHAFDFRVLRTEHFDIHYYPEMEEGARDAARMAERWYTRLSNTFGHTFRERKDIILYADDADFRQTNVLGGMIGEGVQGAVEGFQMRLVMPLTGSYADTDHVLGHEIIHQFQYDISQRAGAFGQFVRLPLWIIEGMAEYFSVGRADPNTAMWLRDAVIRDAFPTLEQLSRDPRYFPYRYGQAFWAWVGGTYGDDAAVQLFRAALVMPLDSAIVAVTGITPDTLGVRWRRDVETAYLPHLRGRQSPPFEGRDLARAPEGRLAELGLSPLPGRRVLAPDIDAGRMNVSPQISPDGRYVAFLSERDLFGIDLFLADAQTGRIIKRLQSVGSDPHLDALRFIDSAGTWSPDGQRFAFVTFVQGDNEIAILDVASREIVQRIQVTGVGAIKDPTWSPDGTQLAFTGFRGGISDIYTVDITGGVARQLIADRHADLQPGWSPDGRQIVFATDRGPGTSFANLTYAPTRLAVLNLDTNQIEILTIFEGAKHIDPSFSPDGESIFFVSDRGGVSNVYRYHRPSGEVFQVTDVATGVSGIAAHSPTLSVASQTGAVMYSVFEAQGYNVYALDPELTQGTLVRPVVVAEATTPPAGVPEDEVAEVPATDPAGDPLVDPIADAPTADPATTADMLVPPVAAADTLVAPAPEVTEPMEPADMVAHTAPPSPLETTELGLLPPARAATRSRVERYLADADLGLPSHGDFPDRPYRPRLRLDYISQPTAGVGYDPYYGMGVGGGIAMRFSDVLSDHIVGVVVQAQGTLKDLGGQVMYLNQRRRLNWGGSVTHIPFLQVFIDAVPIGNGQAALTRFYHRTYLSQVAGLAAYPLSQTRRFEGNIGVRRFGYELEVDYPDAQGRIRRMPIQNVPGFEGLAMPDALYLGEAGTAFVGDYSFFGFTSPVRGGRYRFGVDGTAGSLNFATATADYRRYIFFRPFFTIALRGLHYGRYGPDADARELFPIYLGHGTLVRGYAPGSFDNNFAFRTTADRLYGSRVAVANAELRFPLFGTREFGLLDFPFLPTEVALFGDAGIAWGQVPNVFTGGQGQMGQTLSDQLPIFSAGVSTRINVLGAIILEPYYAYAFSREDGRRGVFGLNFSPGW
jgi:Tol biopolymer transport system component